MRILVDTNIMISVLLFTRSKPAKALLYTAAASGFTTGGDVANRLNMMQASTMIAPSRHTAAKLLIQKRANKL